MKKNAIALASFALLLAAVVASAGLNSNLALDVSIPRSNDPEWRKRFLGSYGFLSGAEPEIKPHRAGVAARGDRLDEGESPRGRDHARAAQVGADSSAALDFVLANSTSRTAIRPRRFSTTRTRCEKFPDFRRAHKNLGLLRVQAERVTAARSKT